MARSQNFLRPSPLNRDPMPDGQTVLTTEEQGQAANPYAAETPRRSTERQSELLV